MEVRINREAEDLEDQVTYLYKYELRGGVKAMLIVQTAFELAAVVLVTAAGEVSLILMGSLADWFLSCAALNGVDATVVDRANHLVDISAKGEDLVNVCAEISRKDEEDLKDAVNYSYRIGLQYQR